MDVAFAIEDGEPIGAVRLTSGALSSEQAFSGADQFKRTMQDLMLEALDLEPISGSRDDTGRSRRAPGGRLASPTPVRSLRTRTATPLWGRTPGTDLQQRLLQVYLGLPWATTLFQARSRMRQVQAEAEMRRRRLPSFGNRSLDDLDERAGGRTEAHQGRRTEEQGGPGALGGAVRLRRAGRAG